MLTHKLLSTRIYSLVQHWSNSQRWPFQYCFDNFFFAVVAPKNETESMTKMKWFAIVLLCAVLSDYTMCSISLMMIENCTWHLMLVLLFFFFVYARLHILEHLNMNETRKKTHTILVSIRVAFTFIAYWIRSHTGAHTQQFKHLCICLIRFVVFFLPWPPDVAGARVTPIHRCFQHCNVFYFIIIIAIIFVVVVCWCGYGCLMLPLLMTSS